MYRNVHLVVQMIVRLAELIADFRKEKLTFFA